MILPFCSQTVATSNLNDPINLFGRKTLLLCKIYTVHEQIDEVDELRDAKKQTQKERDR